MNNKTITAGDVLRCGSCRYERIVSSHWLNEVGRRHFPKRSPMHLLHADLKRFKCSSCGKKDLALVEAALPVLEPMERDDVKGRQLAIIAIAEASPLQREALLHWAQQLIAIRDSSLSVTEKAKASISATIESKAIWPFMQTLGREMKRMGWDDRSLPARIGLGAAAIALLLPGKGAAGIAALGGAIGVPLWVVFGAGGAFAGVIIEEANRHNASNVEPRTFEGEILERTTKDRNRA